ncbi:polysaccharide deacetylase family protein [Tsuneonella sp. HG222]
MTKVYLTIDTEYEFGFAARNGVDTAARAANFDRSIAGKTSTGGAGLAYTLDRFDNFGLKAVFFVDPMPALVWGTGAISQVVEPILARGHDVQLHLHTEWLALAGSSSPVPGRTGQNLKDFALGEQIALLEYAREALMAAGAPKPVAFRAGNYGANDDTLRALASLGFTHDSNHAPGIPHSACAISLGREDRRPVSKLGVIEVPIGCITGARGLRHAQLTALSARELREAAIHARDEGIESFTVVSHSFELLSRDRTQVNRLLQRRFDKFCLALATLPGVRTATYAADPPRVGGLSGAVPTLPRNTWRSGARVIEQVVANVLYGSR